MAKFDPMAWLSEIKRQIVAGQVDPLCQALAAAGQEQRDAILQCPDELLPRSVRDILLELMALQDGLARQRCIALLYGEGGHYFEAERLLQAIIDRAPSPEAWAEIARLRLRAGNAQAAHAAYAQALQGASKDSPVLFEAGCFYRAAGAADRALPLLQAVCECSPQDFDAWLEFGNALKDAGHAGDALNAYQRALSISPAAAEALNNRATVFKRMGRLQEALADWSAALAASPRHLFAYLNRGALLSELGQHEHALNDFQLAVAMAPENPHAHYGLAEALHRLGRHEEALAALLPAELLFGPNTSPHLTRGNCLQALGAFEAAIESYAQCLKIDPAYSDALINWGNALQELGRHDEAIAIFDRALNLQPDYAGARWNRANSRLIQSLSREAWQDYEARHAIGSASRIPATAPSLIGESAPDGKRLLLMWDQRYGDIIHALRYVPEIERRAGACVWQIAPALQPLFAASFPDSRIVSPGEWPAGLDHTLPITSLPYVLGAFSGPDHPPNLANATPYLKAAPESARRWSGSIAKGRPLIGLAWRGQPVPPGRSITLDELRPLLEHGPVRWHALQKDADIDELRVLERLAIPCYGSGIADFADTAALLEGMDLVITIDTAIAHLAAALGKPVWVLLKFADDWRWVTAPGQSTAAWYPNARIFRQNRPRDWHDPVQAVLAALRQLPGT